MKDIVKFRIMNNKLILELNECGNYFNVILVNPYLQ